MALSKPIILDETGIRIAEALEGLGGKDHRELTNRDAADQHPISAVTGLAGLIPAAASSSNKLVSASEMGDAIESVEAKQIYKTAQQGSFATKAELTAAATFYNADGTVATPTKNDVAYVLADESHDGKSAKYVLALTNPLTWGFVITFSDVTFNQQQMNAINSGATAAKAAAWDAKQNAIDDLETIRSGAAAGATALQSVPDTYRTAAAQDDIDDAQDAAIEAVEDALDNTEALVFTLEDDSTVTLNVVVKAVS